MPAEFNNPYSPTKQKPHHIPLKQCLTDNIFPFSRNNIPVELRKKKKKKKKKYIYIYIIWDSLFRADHPFLCLQ